MRAGELRNRVTIQQVTETRDSFGGIIETWSDLATVWASYKALGGRERFAAQQVTAEVSGEFGIRYHAGIAPKMRLVFGVSVFNIEAAIDPDGRRRELRLRVSEVI